MRVRVSEGERYPSLMIEVTEPQVGGAENDQMPNVPPELLNAWQKAERELLKAEHAILKHLFRTDQHRALAPYFDRTRDPKQDRLRHSMDKEVLQRWIESLDGELGAPLASQPLQCGHILTEGPHEGERCMLAPGHDGIHV